MAHSYVSVIATAGQTDFPFNFTNGYLSESHIHVYVNGTEVSRTITGGVAVIAPVAEGAVVRVARQSPATPVITFEDGSILNKQNIDVQTIHNIMLAEEYGEAFTEGDSSGEGSTTFTGAFPPEDAPVSSTWYCTSNGLSYILLDDGDSVAWVESNPNYPSAVGESSLYVSRSGDTMTGTLRVDGSGGGGGVAVTGAGGFSSVTTVRPDGTSATSMQASADEYVTNVVYAQDGAYSHEWLTHNIATQETQIFNPVTSTGQGLEAGSLTRKDYVDGNFLGSKGEVYDGSTDWNTMTSQGVFQFGSEGNIFGPNGPSGVYGYGQIVITAANNTLVQVYYTHDTPSTIAMRMLFGTAWVPWSYITPSASALITAREDKVDSLEAITATLLARVKALEGGV